MLGIGFIFLGYRDEVIRDAVKIGVASGIRVIADDQRNFASQLAVSLAVEKIDEAVIVL